MKNAIFFLVTLAFAACLPPVEFAEDIRPPLTPTQERRAEEVEKPGIAKPNAVPIDGPEWWKTCDCDGDPNTPPIFCLEGQSCKECCAIGDWPDKLDLYEKCECPTSEPGKVAVIIRKPGQSCDSLCGKVLIGTPAVD